MEGETEYWQVKPIWFAALGLDKEYGIIVGGLIYFDKEPLVFIPINCTILDQWPDYFVTIRNNKAKQNTSHKPGCRIDPYVMGGGRSKRTTTKSPQFDHYYEIVQCVGIDTRSLL